MEPPWLVFPFGLKRGGRKRQGKWGQSRRKSKERKEEDEILLTCVRLTGWNCYLSYVNSQGGKEKIDDVLDKEE